MTNYTDPAQVIARLTFSEYANPLCAQMLSTIRGTIASRVVNDPVPDDETLIKYAKQAYNGFTTAYTSVEVNEATAATLRKRTGLSVEQVQQFGAIEYRAMVRDLHSWGLKTRGSKKAVKAESSEVVKGLNSTLSQIERELLQTLIAGGIKGNDILTLAINSDMSEMGIKLQREGKIGYAVQSSNGTVKQVKATDYSNISKANMLEGRARRIARELKAAGGDKKKLGMSDQSWINKNRAYFEAYQAKQLTNGN